MAIRPHAVLDGMLLVAQLITAERQVIWVHDEERATLRSIAGAIVEREGARRRLLRAWGWEKHALGALAIPRYFLIIPKHWRESQW